MTRYEKILLLKQFCLDMAQQTKDVNLCCFYVKAANGYQQKADALTIAEACK